MRSAALVLFLALSGVAALAQGGAAADCTGFAWSLLREQAWFAAAGLERIESGATLPVDQPGAELMLKPLAEAALPQPPTREPRAGTYAGFLRVPAPMMPGLYQVTLSDEGWIDVSQEGEGPRRAVAHTGSRDCPGLRKSVRFQLGAKPVLIEISGVGSDRIKIALAPAD